jgi:predicted nucleotidyltransferase
MFKRDDIPDKIKDFEVVLKRGGIAIDLEMIKESPSFYIHEVGGY